MHIRSKCEIVIGRMLAQSNWERTEDERKVCLGLEKVAAEVGAKSISAGT